MILSSPFAYRIQAGRWRYVLTCDLIFRCPGKNFGSHMFADESGRVWLIFDHEIIIITEEYAWDGASMAPDCPLMESALHDALLQFLCVACFPLTKKECDALFYDAMKLKGFWLRGVYHGAVRIFGGIYSRLTRVKDCGKCLTKHGDER